jgi:hypothetical protein
VNQILLADAADLDGHIADRVFDLFSSCKMILIAHQRKIDSGGVIGCPNHAAGAPVGN